MDAPRTHIFVPCAVTIARAKRAAMRSLADQEADRDTVLSALCRQPVSMLMPFSRADNEGFVGWCWLVLVFFCASNFFTSQKVDRCEESRSLEDVATSHIASRRSLLCGITRPPGAALARFES